MSVSDPEEDGSVEHPYDAIQEAIEASICTGVIVVADGTYTENINLLGKAITLRSSDGPAVTTIDGTGLNDSVVKCVSGEGSAYSVFRRLSVFFPAPHVQHVHQVEHYFGPHFGHPPRRRQPQPVQGGKTC